MRLAGYHLDRLSSPFLRLGRGRGTPFREPPLAFVLPPVDAKEDNPMRGKPRILCLFWIGIAVMTTPASASGFALFGSYWSPHDTADGSFGGGLMFSGSLGKVCALDVRGSYFDRVTETSGNIDPDVQIIPLEAGLRINFLGDQPVNPFIGGGVGYYFFDTDFGELGDEPGYYLVAGIEAGKAKGVSLLLEAIYRKVDGTIEVEPASFLPILVDETTHVDFSGFGANVGLSWRF